jgi:hypothetical protein
MFSRYNITNENDLMEAAIKLELRRNGRKTVTEMDKTENKPANH